MGVPQLQPRQLKRKQVMQEVDNIFTETKKLPLKATTYLRNAS